MSPVFWMSFRCQPQFVQWFEVSLFSWNVVVDWWIFWLVGFAISKWKFENLIKINVCLLTPERYCVVMDCFPAVKEYIYKHIPPIIQATKAGTQANILTYPINSRQTKVPFYPMTFLIQTKHWQPKTPTPHPQTDLHGLRLRGGNFSGAFLF